MSSNRLLKSLIVLASVMAPLGLSAQERCDANTRQRALQCRNMGVDNSFCARAIEVCGLGSGSRGAVAFGCPEQDLTALRVCRSARGYVPSARVQANCQRVERECGVELDRMQSNQ